MRKELGVISLVAMAAVLGCNRNEATDTAATDDTAATEDTAAVDTTTAAEADDATVSNANATFVAEVAQANLLEIQTSELAQAQAQRPDVQAFARMMIEDHTNANEQLLQAAGTMPSTAMSPDSMTQSKIDDLRTAADFDMAYLDLQEQAHEQAVAMFEAYNADGSNPELDAFVSQTLPALREHLEQVRALKTGGGATDTMPDATAPDTATTPDTTLPPDTTIPEETTPPEEEPNPDGSPN